MSDRDNRKENPEPSDAELLKLLAAALTEDGELLPIDEAEVARAEAQGVEEIELPASLALPPRREPNAEPEAASIRGAEPIDLQRYRERRHEQPRARTRFSLLSHTMTAVLGAAAAALLLLYWGPDNRVAQPAGDPVTSASVKQPELVKVSVAPAACADGCCAGADCAKADAELTNCSSGRTCIACDLKELGKSHYRVRTGALFTAQSGDEAIDKYPQGELELCARAGGSREVCLPAHLNDRKTPYLSRLPLLISGEDMGGVLTMRLHWKGVSGEVGTPARITTPIMITPKSLCRGHRVNFKTPSGEVFGNMSLFLDDTHYVELRRAAEPAPLSEYQRSIQWEGVDAVVQQTRSIGADQFVLTLGPFDKPTAERIRWQLLKQNQTAITTVGADYIGESLTLP